jgi:hypothetical protein
MVLLLPLEVRFAECRAMHTTFRGNTNGAQSLKASAKSIGIDSKIGSLIVDQRDSDLELGSNRQNLPGIIHLGSRMVQYWSLANARVTVSPALCRFEATTGRTKVRSLRHSWKMILSM